MLPLSLLALRAPDPAARFDAFMKAHPAFVATVEASVGGKAAGTGTLRVARPRLLRWDAKGTGFDFSVTSTPEQYVAVERVSKTYDERAPIGGFRLYEARVSPAQDLIPGFLLAGSAANALGGGKPTVTAVAGGDELHATVQSQMGPVELRLVVAPDGQPLRFSSSAGARSWRVLAFAAAKADPAPFRLAPPLGTVPYALPELPTPLAVGEAAPLVGWKKGGRAVDLNEPSRGRPRLLAVLGVDSPPSKSARPFLIDLSRSLPVFLIEKGGVEDPTGALMKRLSPPGTPMFYLVGPDGTVKNLWFGFDPAQGRAWEDEVRAAAKALVK